MTVAAAHRQPGEPMTTFRSTRIARVVALSSLVLSLTAIVVRHVVPLVIQ